MKIADTYAAQVVGEAWLAGAGIRGALEPYGLELEDVREWSRPALGALLEVAVAVKGEAFEGRLIGAIGAALIVGIELERSGESELR